MDTPTEPPIEYEIMVPYSTYVLEKNILQVGKPILFRAEGRFLEYEIVRCDAADSDGVQVKVLIRFIRVLSSEGVNAQNRISPRPPRP